MKYMSERNNRAVVAYKLKSVAERNPKVFIKLIDWDLREPGPRYCTAMEDDAYYWLIAC